VNNLLKNPEKPLSLRFLSQSKDMQKSRFASGSFEKKLRKEGKFLQKRSFQK
jgi:hypothetical protein